MFQAIRNSAALVSEQGYLVLAIYQTHWSSPLWKCIKFLYNKSPAIGRRLFIWLFYPLIYFSGEVDRHSAIETKIEGWISTMKVTIHSGSGAIHMSTRAETRSVVI